MKNKNYITYLIITIFCVINSFSTPPPPTSSPPPPQQPQPQQPLDYKLIVLQSTPCKDNNSEECLLVKKTGKSKTETVRIKNFNFNENYTYTLLVKETKESGYKYSLVKILKQNPNPILQSKDSIIKITIEPNDYNYEENTINYTTEKNEEIKFFPINQIIGIYLKKNTKYILKVKVVEKDNQTYLELVEQIEPKLSPPSGDNNGIKATIFYNCNDEEKYITTKNELIYIDYTLVDNNIKIKQITSEQPFTTYSKNIYGFTFIEDYKYTLEVERINKEYKLINILCERKMGYISNPLKKEFPTDINEDDKLEYKPEGEPQIPPPKYKIKELDNAVWYLRYLFQTDSLTPINTLDDTSYIVYTDKLLNKINIKTPCGEYFDKISTDNDNKFIYEIKTIKYKKCDKITDILFKQLQYVNNYEIQDNKLKLSIKDTKYTNPKVLIIFEGFPSK